MTEFEILSLQQANKEFTLNIIIAIIAFISAFLVYLDYRNRKAKERAEKSIKIAEDFAKEIITPLSIICSFFKKTKLDNVINKINFLRFIDFDFDELKELYTETDIETYKILFEKEDANHKIHFLILDTLNSLEYMCMNIVTKVADEKYIYNSLHQQFLKSISLLYFSISLSNTDNKDKYYTNIIQVYNIWKNKYIKVEKKEKKMKSKMKPKIHKIN